MASGDVIAYTNSSGTEVLAVDSSGNVDASGAVAATGALSGSTVTATGLLAGTNAVVALADPGDAAAIPVTASYNIAITTAGAETNTLAIPTFIGQKLMLSCDVYAVGDRVVTVAGGVNQTGNNTLTFGAAADACTLEAFQVAGALVWRITYNDGVALTTV